MDALLLKGSMDGKELFRPGVNWVTTDGPLVVSYINEEGEQTDVFMLDIGTHMVRVPSRQNVLVECHDEVSWDVRNGNPHETLDDTPVEITVVRPRNMMEEMKDQVGRIVARVLRTTVDQLETEEDMQDFNMDEEDGGAPLSIHQIRELIPEDLTPSDPPPAPVPAPVEPIAAPATDPEGSAE